MKPKLSLFERERIIKRMLRGESVSKLSRESGVSRVVLYRWLNRYRDLDRFSNLAKKKSQKQKIKGAVVPKKGFIAVRPEYELRVRIAAIEDVLHHKKTVASVCRSLNISRTIYYRWQKRYQEAGKMPEVQGSKFSEQKALAALENKTRVKPLKYHKQVEEEYEELILNAVRLYPELSINQLLLVLPQVGKKPVVGYHGIQNVLERNQLNTYQNRLEYSLAEQKQYFVGKSSTATILKILVYLGRFPFKFRNRVVGITALVSIPLFFIIIILGLKQYLEIFSTSRSFILNIGYIFATISLVFGLFFLIYSIKYYLSIFLVLRFSRHSLSKSKKLKFFEEASKYRTGLMPDVSDITLQRQPFVSIHLPMFNEKRVVNRLLDAITAVDYDNYEIIVCDDSTDETKDLVMEWCHHQKVKVLHRENRSGYKGGALGGALKIMDPRTEFVIVFDADFLPYPDIVKQFMRYFQSITGSLAYKEYNQSKIAAIQGYQWHVLNKSENWITRGVRTEYAGSYVIERSGNEIYQGLKQIAGSVFMIRSDLLKRYGWGTSITEDFQLTLKLYRDGYKVMYSPYIQTPSECVSTLKRLIRQRMRWAEGHSHNIKRMFKEVLFGRTTRVIPSDLAIGGRIEGSSTSEPVKEDLSTSLRFAQDDKSREFIPSRLTLNEKLEFLYLSPYYLQSFFFLVGTFSWFLAEAVFGARLPFWTDVWGWSLVLTNLLSLPLMNTVGLFFEESEEKDYAGIFSFILLTYIIAPFQAYAAIKGFFEKEEGPWFRTPKTGKITDVYKRGKFYRWLLGILPGKKGAIVQTSISNVNLFNQRLSYLMVQQKNDPYFPKSSRKGRFIGRVALSLLLIFTVTIYHLSFNVSTVHAELQSDGINVLDSLVESEVTAATSWLLKDSGDTITANVQSSVKPGMGASNVTVQFQPGVANNSTTGTPDTNNPTDQGWIIDTSAAGEAVATGNWVASICFDATDTNANATGQFQLLAWRATITGGAIDATSSDLFFDETSTGINIFVDGSQTLTEVSVTGFTFDTSKERIFLEIWGTSLSTPDASDVTSLQIGGTLCATTSRLTSPAVTTPEWVIMLIFVAPFLPTLVKILKKRNWYYAKVKHNIF